MMAHTSHTVMVLSGVVNCLYSSVCCLLRASASLAKVIEASTLPISADSSDRFRASFSFFCTQWICSLSQLLALHYILFLQVPLQRVS